MAETQGNNGSGANQNKTFTQEEVNAIIGERLARQAEKYADYEDLKTKAAEYDRQQEESKTELQKAQEKSAKLQAKVDSMGRSGISETKFPKTPEYRRNFLPERTRSLA